MSEKNPGIMAYYYMLPYPTQNRSLHRLNFVLLCEQHTNAIISYLEKYYLNTMYFGDSILLK